MNLKQKHQSAILDGEQLKVRAHVFVSGRVQGVFFRARTMQKAFDARLNGWVRNLPDGRVEAVFEGEKEAVDAMIEFCRRGPTGALVEKVKIDWEPFKDEFKTFSIRR